MPEIDLATLPVDEHYRDALAPEPGISGGDYGRAAVAGAYGVAGSAAAGIDYLADTDDDSALKKLRHYADEGAKAQVAQMSPAARDALNAGFLPGGDKSIWSPDVSIASSLGLKLANASPSLLASIIPGGLVAGVARGALGAGAAVAGTATSGAVNASMMGGQVYDDIEKSILDAKDGDLKSSSPVYNALRKDYSEGVAKKVLVETAAGNKPLLAAAVGALTDQFGAAAATAKRAVGEAGHGILKGAQHGLVEEAANEAAQNATQEALTQQGQVQAGTGQYDYLKILEQAAQGATVGGIMGGVVGGATGVGGRQGEGAAGSQRLPDQAPVQDAARVGVPAIDPAVAEAAGGRQQSRAALDAVDDAMSSLEKSVPVDPAIAAAVNGGDQIDPRSSFEPQNEFEADPDALPAEEAAADKQAVAPQESAPAPAQEPQEPAQAAPAQAEAPQEQPATQPETAPAVAPSEATETASADLPPVPAGHIRMFHGGEGPTNGGARWATPDPRYARDYGEGGRSVHYVDVPADHPALTRHVEPEDVASGIAQRYGNSSLPEDLAKKMRPVPGLGRKSPTATTIDLDTFLDSDQAEAPSPAPRVLQATEAPAAPSGPREDRRISADERARIAKGEGDAVALSTNPADWTTQSDRNRVKKLAETAIKERGDDAPQWARDYVDAYAQNRRGQGPAPKAAREKLLAARQALHDETQSRVQEGVARRETTNEARDRQTQEKRYRDGTEAERLVSATSMPKLAERGVPKAVRDYAASLLAKAKAAKITIDGATDDAHILHLKTAQEVARAGSTKEQLQQFIADDFLLRRGAGEEISARRRAEAQKYERSYDEVQREGPEVREGADAAEAYDAQGAHAEAAVEPADGTDTAQDRGEDRALAEPVSERVSEPVVDPADQFVVVGQNKAGQFKVESRGRRKVAERKAIVRPAVRQTENRPLPYGRNTPRAREANPDADAHARELARLLGDEPEVDTGNLIVSPRTGAATPILHTATVADYLKNVDHKVVGGVAAQVNPFIARRLAQLIPDVKVHTVSREGMRVLTEDLAGKGGFPSEISGYYDPVSHEIVLRDQDISEAELSHLIIHEGLHAAFMRTIERVPAAKRLIRDLMNDAVTHYGDTFNTEYGMTNEHEFVSEAMSSRDFQEKLAKVPVSGSFNALPTNNVWTHFVAKVRAFLGLRRVETSALDAALRVGAVLTDLRTAHDQPSTPRTVYAMPHALGVDTIREGFSDVKGATRLVATAKVLRVRTLDQIRQGYRNLFPTGEGADHLDKLVNSMQRQNAYVEGKSREADTHVQDFLNLKKSNRKVAEDFAVLANDVTMADLNLLKGKPSLEEMQAANKHVYGSDPKKSDVAMAWQSKAQHAELQRRFSALPDAVQDQFLKAARFYRDTQNETARTFVSSILDQMAPDMNVAQRSEIAAKALAGTLNEDDAKALNNTTLYNALKDAGSAKSIKGMYFPLKRNGDYVVRTRDVVGDTMGGKEVEPGVVEFSGDNDKASRRQAEAFAKQTGLKVTRIAKRFYDHQTGELIKAVDAEKDSRVAYRVTLQTHGLHMFESAREAEKFVREARRDGDFHAVEDVQRRQDMEARGDLNYSQLSALTRSVDQRDDLTAGQREILKTAIAQAAIRQMSGNRIQKHSLARKFYSGASEDFGRNMLQYATAQSNYIGKLKYMPGIRDHLGEMEKQANAFNADKSQLRKTVFEEVKNRVNANDTGLNKPSKVVRDLMQVAMLSKLAGPSHSIINAAQPLMTTYPVLAGEHGPMSSALELGKAMKDIGAWRTYGMGVTNSYKAARHLFETSIDATDPVGSIRKKLARQPDGAALGRVLSELQERGALGDGAEFEMAAAIASGRGVAGTAIAKADRIFRQAPAAVEAVNRAGSAVAAYRLARRKGMSEEKATQYAFDTVQKTQFDYSGFNAPPVFNNQALRPFLQFKKYGQAMTELYASMIYRSFKGDSKADRQVAMKQFAALTGMHALMAGAFAVPGLEAFKVVSMVAAALGLGAGPADQERRFKRWVEAAAGKEWGDIVQSGLVSHVLGVDLSSRMSAADLWTYGEPKKYTGSEIGGWIGAQLLGASGNTVLDMRDGLGAIEDGDYLKGAIKIVPAKALTDIGKAIKGYTSDKTHLSPGEAVAQGLGFKPKRIADQQEKLSDTIADRNKVKAERDKLRNRYLDAGSAGARLKIRAQIVQYNKSAEQRMRLSIPSLDKMRDRDTREGLR